MGIRTGYLSVKASINLWVGLVRSILEYGCEVWGDEVWKVGEGIQLDMGRRILRCSAQTTLEAIRGELGFWTLQARRDFKKLMYFVHILSLPESRILKQVYLLSRS